MDSHSSTMKVKVASGIKCLSGKKSNFQQNSFLQHIKWSMVRTFFFVFLINESNHNMFPEGVTSTKHDRDLEWNGSSTPSRHFTVSEKSLIRCTHISQPSYFRTYLVHTGWRHTSRPRQRYSPPYTHTFLHLFPDCIEFAVILKNKNSKFGLNFDLLTQKIV